VVSGEREVRGEGEGDVRVLVCVPGGGWVCVPGGGWVVGGVPGGAAWVGGVGGWRWGGVRGVAPRTGLTSSPRYPYVTPPIMRVAPTVRTPSPTILPTPTRLAVSASAWVQTSRALLAHVELGELHRPLFTRLIAYNKRTSHLWSRLKHHTQAPWQTGS